MGKVKYSLKYPWQANIIKWLKEINKNWEVNRPVIYSALTNKSALKYYY